MQIKHLFSSHSKQYATFRPTYPKGLYDFVFKHVKKFETAWDCGTGNGQVARDLSPKFKKVQATDISANQLANAYQAENIFYSAAGEETIFPDRQFDLITVAQAIHWFDISKFYTEVSRVAREDAILAIWGYSLLSINPEIDTILKHFYTEIVGTYWDKERKLIDEQYKTIPFPYDELQTPEFKFSLTWTLEEFRGYISTWSAVQKYIRANKIDPVDNFIKQILPFWKSPKLTVSFPLFLRLGKVSR